MCVEMCEGVWGCMEMCEGVWGVWRCVRVCVSVCGFVYAHMCVLYTCTWMFYYYFNSF